MGGRMSRLIDLLKRRFGDEIIRRALVAAVLTALLLSAVGIADPFYQPPESAPVDTDASSEAVALSALNATGTTDYRMDWITPCDRENVTRRAGGCVFLRYTVERSDREYAIDNGKGYSGAGPDVYVDEVSATYHDYSNYPDRSQSSALNLWEAADRLDRRSLAATLASPAVETTTTEQNGTIYLRTENETVASGLLGTAGNASASPEQSSPTVTVAVDAESGWLQSIRINDTRENGTADWQRYQYDQWGTAAVERPAGTSRPLLGWVFDAINREYRPQSASA